MEINNKTFEKSSESSWLFFYSSNNLFKIYSSTLAKTILPPKASQKICHEHSKEFFQGHHHLILHDFHQIISNVDIRKCCNLADYSPVSILRILTVRLYSSSSLSNNFPRFIHTVNGNSWRLSLWFYYPLQTVVIYQKKKSTRKYSEIYVFISWRK